MKKTKESKTNHLTFYLIVFILAISGCVSEEASPYYPERKCWGADEVVDTSFSLGGGFCGRSTTYAEDEDGNLWYFSTTCLPSCFQEINPDDSIVYAPPCHEIE